MSKIRSCIHNKWYKFEFFLEDKFCNPKYEIPDHTWLIVYNVWQNFNKVISNDAWIVDYE